jgi:mycofactocin precursor peptide peptidase
VTTILLPLGSCEQHGPHLPRDTDTRIAVALAQRAAEWLDDVWVAPALAFGASWEHHGFDGLLSLNDGLLHDVVVELARSADWADGIVLINGHGGNLETLHRAVRTIRHDGRAATTWSPRVAGGDAHAGHTETSLMLAIAADTVRMDLAAPGWTGSVSRRPVRELSSNGVLGDPTNADALAGRRLLSQLAEDLVATVERWRAAPGAVDA